MDANGNKSLAGFPVTLVLVVVAFASRPALAQTPPVAVISPPSQASAKANSTVTYTVTYTGATSVTLSAADITLQPLPTTTSGGPSASVSVSGSGTSSRVVVLTGFSGNGTLGLAIASGTASNASGAAVAKVAAKKILVDTTPPAVTIVPPAVSLARSGMTVSYRIDYTGAVASSLSDATKNKIGISATGNATASVAISGTGPKSRIVTFSSITGNGTLSLSVSAGTSVDAAGNLDTGAALAAPLVVDNTPPSVAIGTASAGHANPKSTISFPVTYSGAGKIGLTAKQVQLVATGDASATVRITGTGNTTRTVTLSGFKGNGTIAIGILAGSAIDAAGNLASASSANSAAVNVDTTAPTISVSGASAGSANAQSTITYNVTYSGATAITLAPTDIVVSKAGTANVAVAVSGSGTTSRTVTLTGMSGNGSVIMAIKAGTATDAAGNLTAAVTPRPAISVDNVSPTVLVTVPSSIKAKANSSVTYQVKYTGASTVSLTQDKITLITTGDANASVGIAGTDPKLRVVTLSSFTGNGTIAISIAPGSAVDNAGNADAGGSNGTAIVVDTVPPTLSIGDPVTIVSGTNAAVTFPVTYSGASTITLLPAKINVTSTGSAVAAAVSVKTTSASIRAVTFSGFEGSGNLSFQVAAGSATDAAGNLAAQSSVSKSFAIGLPAGATQLGIDSVDVSPFKNSLILHLDSTNTQSYPGSGTTWTDLSARNNHMTLTNVKFDAASTRSLIFNGSSSSATPASVNLPLNDTDFTVDSLVRTVSNPNSYQEILLLRTAAGHELWLSKMRSGFNDGRYYSGILTPTTWAPLTWTYTATEILNAGFVHLTTVFKKEDGTYKQYNYWNGALNNSGSTGLSSFNLSSPTEFNIGKSNQYGDYHNGNLALMRLYSRALTPLEISKNHQDLNYRVAGLPADKNLDFIVTTNTATIVTGTPTLHFKIGGSARTATYVSGSGTSQLLFRYVTAPGDNGIVAWDAGSITGGTIGLWSSPSVPLTRAVNATTTTRKVDTTPPSPPAFSTTNSNFLPPLTVTVTATAIPDTTFREFRYNVSNGSTADIPADCSSGTVLQSGETIFIPSGTTTVAVIACDESGNGSTAKVATFSPVTTACGGKCVASTSTPLTETSARISWTAPSAGITVTGYKVILKFPDNSVRVVEAGASDSQVVVEDLAPGSTFLTRVVFTTSTASVPDSGELTSFGFTPFGAINANTASSVPQEPWKPSGLEGLAISENFSIVWSFFWNPGFTPAWSKIPSGSEKGEFYFNTSMNRAYENSSGIIWGGRDDVTQLWTNGVDKFIVGTWRGRLHLWDYLPNNPNNIAHSRQLGLGSTNRSTFSGTASACYDSSVDKLYVTNGGRHRVLVFNGWPTTSDAEADLVLGQPNFDTFTAATSATGMNNPWSLSCHGGVLAVADLDNRRVLVWTKAITTNNQAADFIYGQSDATSAGSNGAGGVGVGGVAHPRAVLLVPRASGGHALLVADTTQNRVLEWSQIPATPSQQSFPGAFDRVYGQPDRTSTSANNGGQSMSSMAAPVALSQERDTNGVAKNDTFWVADGAYWTTHNSRILKFNRGETTAADLWGDANGTTSLSGWSFPADRVGFWWANYVNASRIGCMGSEGIFNLGGYIWKKAPANGVTPSDFTDGARCHTATAGGLSWIANGASIWGLNVSSGTEAPSPLAGSPVLLGRKGADGNDNASVPDTNAYKIGGVGDMASSGNSLMVLDSNRIAIWNTSGVASHASISAVIGQPDKTTNGANQGGLSAKTLNGPRTMVVNNGKIIVADSGNNRVMIWNSVPSADNQSADVILGQADGTTNATGSGMGNMNSPISAAVINGKLVVTDRGNNRVLVWRSIPLLSGTAADHSMDLRDYRFSLPAWYNPGALIPNWIRGFGDRVYVEQYGRVLVLPDIFGNMTDWGIAAGFQPNQISGLTLWLDSSDGRTLFQDSAGTVVAQSDTDYVGMWKDKSGNSRHATQVSNTASRPMLKTNQRNGKPAVYFDGSGTWLSNTAYSYSGPVTVFIVASNTYDNGYYFDGAGGTIQMGTVRASVTTLKLWNGQQMLSDANFNLANPSLVQSIWNGANSFLGVNGQLSAVGVTNPVSLTGYTVGRTRNGSGAGVMQGNIFEIVVYEGALSTTQRLQVENYLNLKWNLY